MSHAQDTRALRLRKIASRWPRFGWDYQGLARWQSFDQSLWTGLLTAGSLFTTAYSDFSAWWSKPLVPLPLLGAADEILLVLLILSNVWILDRLLAAKTPAGFSAARWVRAARVLGSAVPLLGLSVIPAWQALVRRRPAWAFVRRSSRLPLLLDGPLPSRFGFAGWQTRIDTWLRSWSQLLIPQALWLIGCQLTPLFSGLYLLSQHRPAAALMVNVLLHLTGAAFAAAHVAVRIRTRQMSGVRAILFRFLPLVALLPVPFSLLTALIWLPFAEPEKEDKGVVQTLYSSRISRRHPFAAVRGPRLGEITSRREAGRRYSAMVKLGLLALESAVVAGIAASFGFGVVSTRLAAVAILPGAILLIAGAITRTSGRCPRLGFLADHPYAIFLTFLPLAVIVGILAGLLAASHDVKSFRLFTACIGFGGILVTLLAAAWTYLLEVFWGVPERSYAGRFASMATFVLLILLALALSDIPVRLFVALIVLASPCIGFVTAFLWLAPLRFRDLNDPRLPIHLRRQLRGVALTALLPLGGLAVPAWFGMRHRHGRELDKWAGQLRERSS